ncbi:MAG: hybrid sensor histidine kinase/response regulator, partial [Lachnospiraceae bacterium]|nr:hybrid sensor histidine kinase/response regulator [Lachnospiraceae bacterium]
MKQQKKTWQQILYALLFLTVVLILFYTYTMQNQARIQEQNRIYAEDCARQVAERIESEFDNALQRIQNSAYLISTDGEELKINAGVLREMEENTTFDAIRFTNADGLNLASNGETSDSSDRDYFARGMRGESGVETVAQSRITGRPMMVFYAPIYRGKEVAGMFLGLYFAEDYLQDMVSASYFGEAADVFLCTQEGKVIADSNGSGYGVDLFDFLTGSGVIDNGTAEKARTVFTDGGEIALLCGGDCKTDNLCVVDLPGHKYVLAQVFPQNITQAMVRRANMAGVRLEISLLILFVVYILFLAVHAQRQQKKLERENRLSGGYFTFDTEQSASVEYKIAISYVSVENAKENL